MAAPKKVRKCPKYTERLHRRPRASGAECGDDGQVGDGPGRERAVHPPLMPRNVEPARLPAPGKQHGEPGGEGECEDQPAPGLVADSPLGGDTGGCEYGEGED